MAGKGKGSARVTQTNAGGDGWAAQVRRVVMAGVGAATLAQEEIEQFIGRLVKRGEMAEKDGRKLLSDALSRRKQDVSEGLDGLQSGVSAGVEKVFQRMKLVSRDDIVDLNRRIDEIAKKLDRLETGSRK